MCTANDAYGNLATGYRGTVHFTSSDAAASLPANYTFTSADGGSHTFSATLNTAGTQSITGKDTVTPTITGTQSGILVTAASVETLFGNGLLDTEDAGGILDLWAEEACPAATAVVLAEVP